MSTALWIGTTGLSASNKQLDVIGNNLANANTVGFKSSDISFSSMLSQSLSGGSGGMQVGQGVGISGVTTQFSQGSFESTGNPTDVSIDGAGFFIVKNPKEDLIYYTRAGSFYINKDGDLADMSGYLVQGHMIDAKGVESTEMTKINLTGRKSQPHKTTEFKLGLNLNIETNPSDAVNYFNATQTIYDSAGRKHSLTTKFERCVETENLWLVSAKVDNNQYVFAKENSWLEFNDAGEMITSTRRQILAGEKFFSDTKGTPVMATTMFGKFYDADGKKEYDCTAGKIIRYYGVTHSGVEVGDDENPRSFTITANSTLRDFLDDVVQNFGGADSVEATIVDGRIILIDKMTGESSLSLTICPQGTNSNNSTADVVLFGTISATNSLGQVGAQDLAKANKTFDFSTFDTSIGNGGVITWDLTSQNCPEITSYALDSRVNYVRNDGYSAGLLNSLDVNANGIIVGFFTNGQQQELARILTASFTNNNGLHKVGSYFMETAESGAPTIGNPSEGGLGSLQSHSLEISNTDVAREFIKMIAAQRAYQANARIITAANDMLQELMNIKR